MKKFENLDFDSNYQFKPLSKYIDYLESHDFIPGSIEIMVQPITQFNHKLIYVYRRKTDFKLTFYDCDLGVVEDLKIFGEDILIHSNITFI